MWATEARMARRLNRRTRHLVPDAPGTSAFGGALHVLFSNGDGGLILFADEDSGCKKAHCLRLLYTDSGHYLLPIDDPEGQKREEPQMAKVCADALKAVVASLDKLSSKADKVFKSNDSKNVGRNRQEVIIKIWKKL